MSRSPKRRDLISALGKIKAANDVAPLTARQVADLCGVELKTVHNWVSQGLIEHFRTPGRHLRFLPHQVASFLSRCGYQDSIQRSAGATALVLACRATRTRLRRALKEMHVTWTEDPYAALVTAGSLKPDLVVIEGRLLPKMDAEAYLDSIVRNLPNTKLLWLAKPPRRAQPRKVTVVAADDVDSLRWALAKVG